MTEVRETKLPGVGVRHEFTAEDGVDVAVIVHHDGRREVVAYDEDDPDACHTLVSLTEADSITFGQILGVSPVTETVSEMRHVIEEVAIDWTEIPASAEVVGSKIGAGEYRTVTGATIVAVIRNNLPLADPDAEFVLEAGDVVVAVGPTAGLTQLHSMLGG